MRLFIAITFSGDLKKYLMELKKQLKQMGVEGNFTLDENLHLTLCFVGETQQAEKIKGALKQVKFSPFELELAELQSFRDMLWIGIKKNPDLYRLTKRIKTELDKAGIDYDRKPFKGHITLVRKLSGEIPSMAIPSVKMRVEKVTLMKSGREKGKLVYTEI